MLLTLKKFLSFFKKYPYSRFAFNLYTKLIPVTLHEISHKHSIKNKIISFQLTDDPLYLGIFSMLMKDFYSEGYKIELIDTRSINSSVGNNFFSYLKRSLFFARIQSNQWIRFYNVFNPNIAYRSKTFNPILDIKAYIQAHKILGDKEINNETFKDLEINELLIGDLIIDTFLRFKPSAAFNKDDKFTKKILAQALKDIWKSEKYFSSVKPDIYFTSYSCYIMNGIAVRSALKNNVDVISFGNIIDFGKRLSNSNLFHSVSTEHYKKTFYNLESKDKLLQIAENGLLNKLNGGRDMSTIYMSNTVYGNKQTLEVPIKDKVVIFLHDFNDSPHVYKNFIFNDFWSWLTFTIKNLSSFGIQFVIKPHPNTVQKDEATYRPLDNLRSLFPGIDIISPYVPNTQLVDEGMICGITAYGTVAHEIAYLGVPSITCACHPHISFNFCKNASSIEEYRYLLKKPEELPISKCMMREEALAFFYMHSEYGNKDDLFLKNEWAFYNKACYINDFDDAANRIASIYKSSAYIKFFNSFKDNIY